MITVMGGDPRADIDSALSALSASVARDGWFGPARIAYDEVVSSLVRRLVVVDVSAGHG